MMAKINFPKKRTAIAVVMKIKEKLNKYWEGFFLETP